MDRTKQPGAAGANKHSGKPTSPDPSDGRHPSKDAEMRTLFTALDKDKNGYIDKRELRLTMMEVGLELSEKDLDNMMKAAGVIIKDRIFYEDFVRMMTGKIGQSQRKALIQQASGEEPSTYSISGEDEEHEVQAMRVAFSMFDRDGDGLISEQEVHDTMKSLGIEISLKEVKQIVRRVDPNSDGMIGFDKFLLAMRKYQAFKSRGDHPPRCSGGHSVPHGGEGGEGTGSGAPHLDSQQRDLIDAAFHVFDKDRDGFLNAHDLRVTMDQLGLVLSEEDVHAMMKSVGIGPQGKISHADFCRIYSSKTASNAENQRSPGNLTVTKKQEAEFRAVFSIFDVDRDGYITMEEVVEVLVSMGIHPSHECIAQVFHQVDLDGNGKIDFREFLLLISKYERPLPENVEMREMFNALDKDRNGIVDPEELKSSFAELGIPLTDADVKAMMREADVQGDTIRYEDFVRIISCQMNNVAAFSSAPPKQNAVGGPERAEKSRRTGSAPERQPSSHRADRAASRETETDISSSTDTYRKSSNKSPSRSQSTTRSEKTPRDSTKGSIKSSTSSRPSAQTDNVPIVETRSKKDDVTRPISGDLDRAIYASLESAAKSEQRRSKIRTNHDTKHDEVRDFFSESLSGESFRATSYHPPESSDPAIPSKTSTCKAPNTWIAFKVFDCNSDGYISKTELHRTMNDLGINLSKEDLEYMMEEADINKDGRIDYAEFSKLMNGSFEAYANQAAQITSHAKQTLPSIQSNGTISSGTGQHHTSPPPNNQTSPPAHSPPGGLSPPSSPPRCISESPSVILTELQQPPPPYRPPCPPYPPPPLPEDVDEERDGAIRAVNSEQSMREAFRAFDLNGDGLIDPTELRKTMKSLGETLTDDDVNAMIKVVDINLDGKVDYEGSRFPRLLIKCKNALKLNKYKNSQTNSLNVHTSIGAERDAADLMEEIEERSAAAHDTGTEFNPDDPIQSLPFETSEPFPDFSADVGTFGSENTEFEKPAVRSGYESGDLTTDPGFLGVGGDLLDSGAMDNISGESGMESNSETNNGNGMEEISSYACEQGDNDEQGFTAESMQDMNPDYSENQTEPMQNMNQEYSDNTTDRLDSILGPEAENVPTDDMQATVDNILDNNLADQLNVPDDDKPRNADDIVSNALDNDDNKVSNDDVSAGDLIEHSNDLDKVDGSTAMESESTAEGVTQDNSERQIETTDNAEPMDSETNTSGCQTEETREENKEENGQRDVKPDPSALTLDGDKSGEKASGAEVITEGSPSKQNKQQECVVCNRVTKCKYNIVRNGDTRHLCDDTCFKVFRQQPTAYLHPSRAVVPDKCDQCQSLIGAEARLKHVVRAIPGKNNKHFCLESCMNDYKKTTKFCTSCSRDMQADKSAFFLPINNGEEFKDFCSHACMSQYESTIAPTPVQATRMSNRRGRGRGGKGGSGPASSKCVTCGGSASKQHEITFMDRANRFCSASCAGAFRALNSLDVHSCAQCKNACPLDGVSGTPDGSTSLQIQFEGEARKFCSSKCLAAFKSKRTRAVACVWCGVRKSNFEMVERIDVNNKFQQFCSLNCLSLYRVNLQANSKVNVACDHCCKCAPAQYHLTMSDASVRNFCGYNCVMAFQAQFTQPALSSDISVQQPTPGNQVTPNTAHNTPTGTRASARSAAKAGKVVLPKTPVISNIVSLASNSNQKGPSAPNSQQSASPPMEQQIIIQPPPPKQLKNKSLQCKPLQQTKATSCRPTNVSKSTQTDESWKPHSSLLPVPVPLHTPAPMTMYSSTTPVPIFIPIPIPIPCFVPTTKKSAKGILKKIKEMQDRLPSDPFEAELLMMAEAVASADKDSESDDDDVDDDGGYEPDSPVGGGGVEMGVSQGAAGVQGAHAPGSSELAEDMLQMALRMASEMPDEPILDLEDSVDPTPVPRREIPAMGVTSYGSMDHDMMQGQKLNRNQAVANPGGTPKTKRRSTGGGGGGRRSSAGGSTATAPKRPKLEMQEQAPVHPPQPTVPEPPADANMVLKFTYGVNAYKHWAMQKNAALERNAAMGGPGLNLNGPRYLPGSVINGKVRPFKLDILQCTAEELNYSLCMFVKEVHKPNGEEYAPDSIYYLCLGIQEFMYENGRIDNIFTDLFYERFTDCLNEVLSRYEVRLNTQGLLVCRIEEEHLWECKQLGAHSPHVLLNTLVYFNTKHFMLRTSSEHLSLSFSHIMKHWKKTTSPSGKPGRSVYLRYYAPAHILNQGGEVHKPRKKEDMPVFEQCENTDNPLRCPVKLYEFYLSKCPESIKSRNDVFYLVPERSCVPDSPVWYSTQALGAHHMSKMLNRLNTVREVQESQLGAMQPYYN